MRLKEALIILKLAGRVLPETTRVLRDASQPQYHLASVELAACLASQQDVTIEKSKEVAVVEVATQINSILSSLPPIKP